MFGGLRPTNIVALAYQQRNPHLHVFCRFEPPLNPVDSGPYRCPLLAASTFAIAFLLAPSNFFYALRTRLCGILLLMLVLIVLLVSWLLLRAVGVLGVGALASWHDTARYALAIMFVFTASAHFAKMRHDLARMIPSGFPNPLLLVYVTGVLELLGAAGLLLPRFHALAGICLIILLIVMFVANVNAAQKHVTLGGRPATPLWLRLPMQLFFIALLYWSTR